MQTARILISDIWTSTRGKIRDYAQLAKLRLSITVVFSSVIAYAIAAYGSVELLPMIWLFLGGFLITAGANAVNQVLEKDLDKLMTRTADRPMAAGRMHVTEGILAAGIMAMAGISILWLAFNPLSAMIGALSFLLYSFVYTPLKQISPIAVFVGAIPGALPPVIGWAAFTGTIGMEAVILFGIQFLWQFPHFWAIAWVAEEDYKRAGFKLLPSSGGRDKFTGFQCLIYSVVMIPVSLMPVAMGWVHWYAGVAVFIVGLWFVWKAFTLFRKVDMQSAKNLMLASFAYLPIVLIALLSGRII